MASAGGLHASVEEGNHLIYFGCIEGFAGVLSGAMWVPTAASVVKGGAFLVGKAKDIEHLGVSSVCPG